MTANELYTKEARVWIPHPEFVWRGAELIEDYTGQAQLKIRYEDGEESTIAVKSKEELPPLRNPEILVGENDLTSLSYLHEPAVLYNLQVRFCERSAIYTYCGIVLVAINPYEQLPIYGQEIIQAYSGQDLGIMDPHIFAVAEEAYKNMSQFDENQSIIVSGESGAGKTVSAKYAMRYFASVGGSEAETNIEKKVLASNPIMEAFGNAKTTRNDNSSRFGKYIEIGFNKAAAIIGANMRTYLLEKSRVVFQAQDERNYHIFYQLCASSELPEFEAYKLSHQDNFTYTRQGDSPDVDGVDDAEELETTREAFTLLGVRDKDQMLVFQVLAAILHFGNLQVLEDESDSSTIAAKDPALIVACQLLGIDGESVRMWLCNRKIATKSEVLTKPLRVHEASFGRDALSKHIYARLFDWIVRQINKSLRSGSNQEKFIGVLDIYGFETFEINSFEQFCINYANEKLQQQFNRHVFILEQEEYNKEEILWSFIDFYDNQPCIDLIENKLGILDLLDEECKMPRGSDANWCQKLYDKHTKAKHFSKPRMSNTAFIVHHFADDVTYQIEGFLEKNRDTVFEEQIDILKASTFEFIAELFSEKNLQRQSSKGAPSFTVQHGRPAPKQPSKQHRSTVGSQFRDSLKLLMEALSQTTPHYVRCIKPNDFKQAFVYEPKRTVQQLRACGVLETIRISAAGYPSRWTYQEFIHRYRVLAQSKQIVRKDMKSSCQNILTQLIQDPDKFQFGKTKIFFRAGQVAYLEKLRADKLRYCGIMIQKHIKGWLQKNKYKKICTMVHAAQRRGRGLLARRKAMFLRRTRAAIIVQKYWRCYTQRQQYVKIRTAAITIQSYARGRAGRLEFLKVKANAKAITIQRYVRGWLARRRYLKFVRGMIKLQSHVRRRAARKQLKALKIEAKSVDHIKKVNLGLENKIIELCQRMESQKGELVSLRGDQEKMNELRAGVDRLEKSEKSSATRIEDLLNQIRQLQLELQKEKGERDMIENEKNILKTETDHIILTLTEENKALKDELNDLTKSLSEKKAILHLQTTEAASNQLEYGDIQQERANHQRVLKENTRLQQRCDNLASELAALRNKGVSVSRSASDASSFSQDGVSPLLADVEEGRSPADDKDLAELDDLGYGSTRRKTSPVSEAEAAITSGRDDKLKQDGSDAVALVVKLQNRIKELEKERHRLVQKVEHLTNQKTIKSPESAYDQIKSNETELENVKLRDELAKLRRVVAESADFENAPGEKGQNEGPENQKKKIAKEFMDQFEAMTDELERRREECISLRALVADRTRSTSSIIRESYRDNPELLNEDGELEIAYRTQKDLNKLLEGQLQGEENLRKQQEVEYKKELGELRKENEKQQKLINQLRPDRRQSLTLPPGAKIEATMQHEITRLTSENLDLREQNDKLEEMIKKLKKAIKIYAKRLKHQEGLEALQEIEQMTRVDTDSSDQAAPVIKLRERDYRGLLEYRREDETLLIKNLVYDLKPKVAATLLPGLPAYILFMCIRHTDYVNDDDKVRTLLTATISGIKKIVKKRHEDLETMTLWLANTCRLLHNLKQYSGEKTFQQENSPKQNEHCLQNFDLSEYRQVLSDLAVWIYQGLIKLLQQTIQPMIVPAILEHEAIAGLSAGKPTGMRGRTSSVAHDKDPERMKRYTLDSLVKALNQFHKNFQSHALDPELTQQTFCQVFYFICAGAINNLLLRKEMCNWSKGMQIRYNLSHLEQWLRDNKLIDSGALNMLDPIIQASQLLQARKTTGDVSSACEMCSKLTVAQIVKILNLYTPVDDYDERVPISFIRKVQEHLKSRASPEANSLLMDTKHSFPVTFPFTPSSLSMDTIAVPDVLNLHFLKRL